MARLALYLVAGVLVGLPSGWTLAEMLGRLLAWWWAR
jgi:F0F1-type ATP synthase assembly protein I